MGSDARRETLLGPAARPLLIKVISQLRPEFDPVAVGGAVERIVLSGEECTEKNQLWQEIKDALADLENA